MYIVSAKSRLRLTDIKMIHFCIKVNDHSINRKYIKSKWNLTDTLYYFEAFVILIQM